MRVMFLLLWTTLIPTAAETHVSLVAKVGGRVIPAEGNGECSTSSESTIYDVPTTQWHAMLDGGNGSELENVNVTVWRPKAGGPDQVTLFMTVGKRTHRIATVSGGEQAGRATASARPEGKGGTLLVEGTTAEGTPITLELRCSAFSEIVDGNG
jgi:hypothetical protein